MSTENGGKRVGNNMAESKWLDESGKLHTQVTCHAWQGLLWPQMGQ